MHLIANGIDLHFTRRGTGPGHTALVFLHFWGGSSRTWSEVIDRLADDFDCIALDARGQGGSEAPAQAYGVQDQADDVLAALAALGVERYFLVGHSMGGKTAQAIASRRPAGLRGIALIASSPPSPMAIGDEQRAQMKHAYASAEAVEWSLDNVLLGSPVPAEVRARTIEDARRISAAATAGWIDTASREDLVAEVAAIEVPVLVVAGELDRVDPVAVVRGHLMPHHAQAVLHLLPAKGHLLPIEAPREVAALVREFATTTAAAAATA